MHSDLSSQCFENDVNELHTQLESTLIDELKFHQMDNEVCYERYHKCARNT